MIPSSRWHIAAACLVFAGVAWAQPSTTPATLPSTIPTQAQRLFADYPRPDVGLPFADYSRAWPARWKRDAAGIQGEIVPIAGPIERPSSIRVFRAVPSDAPELIAPIAALKKAAGAGDMPGIRGEDDGSFVYETMLAPRDRPLPRARRHEASLDFMFVSATLANAEITPHTPETIELERTWFSLFEPLQANGEVAQPRAVVLLMPGLFGTPGGTLDLLTNRLRREGYAVLRMLAQPSRFTQVTRFGIDREDIPRAAGAIAHVLSTRAAECAYAAQGAFVHLARERPALATLPRMAIGFSGGAMTLPTVVAREPEAYAACVMVGGGCHFWLMNDTSNYASIIDAIDVWWEGETPTQEEKRALADAYLSMAPLDSFHTARALHGRKSLLIHGTLDKAVPAPLGDALWERLGRPERWEREYGHEALFMALPSDMGPMIRWLGEALERGEP